MPTSESHFLDKGQGSAVQSLAGLKPPLMVNKKKLIATLPEQDIFPDMWKISFNPNSGIVLCFQRLGASRELSCIERLNGTTITYMSRPTKTSICQFWKDNTDCITNQVKNTCIPDIELDMFLGNMTAAFQKPCKE